MVSAWRRDRGGSRAGAGASEGDGRHERGREAESFALGGRLRRRRCRRVAARRAAAPEPALASAGGRRDADRVRVTHAVGGKKVRFGKGGGVADGDGVRAERGGRRAGGRWGGLEFGGAGYGLGRRAWRHDDEAVAVAARCHRCLSVRVCDDVGVADGRRRMG